VGEKIEGACNKTGSSSGDRKKFEVVVMSYDINIVSID
jgi:hypothetical protein